MITAFRRPNRALAFVLLGVAVTLCLTLLWPYARELFRFGPLHADDLMLAVGAGAIVLILLDALKPLWRKRLSD